MATNDRIRTTHTGSLARPKELVQLMWDTIEGKDVDPAELDDTISTAVEEVVRRQLEIGIDVVGDGEMSKIGFSNYIHGRLSGFEVSSGWASPADLAEFPDLRAKLFSGDSGKHIPMYDCVGPIEVTDEGAVHKDIERFKNALGDRDPSGAFLNAVSPGQIAFNHPNQHYASHEDYLEAAANAMRHEYKAIADAGFNLQIDSPDLAMAQHFHSSGADLPEFPTLVKMSVETLNHALEGIPAEQVRLHVCWGNYPGTHHKDVPLADVIDSVMAANVQTISFEAANPCHAHEWEVFETFELPDDKVLMPGVIDVQTNRIEHPRLVAQRLERFAGLVGRDRVIAGTDCGFGTFVGRENVDPEVGWAKLGRLVEGARLAG